MKKSSKIYVAGHRGLVGSAILRKLKSENYTNILLRTKSELNLLNQKKVDSFFANEKPEYVFMAAAKVGGIWANKTKKAEFIYENLQVQNNIIHSAWKHGVKKLLFLGSSCIYPQLSKQPIKEEYLLTGKLEPSNDAYAIAKIAGIFMCNSYREQFGANFISVMPTNLYGPNDNFDLESSHVLPALIRKFIDAKKNKKPEVKLWGTGSPKREFMHVEDLADAVVYLMKKYNQPEIVNIGTGKEVSIKQLAQLIKSLTDYRGKVVWDSSKPDGTPRKLLDVAKLKNLGWTHKIELEDGLKSTIEWYLKK